MVSMDVLFMAELRGILYLPWQSSGEYCVYYVWQSSREYCIYYSRAQGNTVFTIAELKGILCLLWQSSVKGLATNTVLTMAMPRVNFRHIT